MSTINENCLLTQNVNLHLHIHRLKINITRLHTALIRNVLWEYRGILTLHRGPHIMQAIRAMHLCI